MLAIILCSFLLGVALTLLVQIFIVKRWFIRLPKLGPTYRPQYSRFTLPEELQSIIQDPHSWDKKETCQSLNLIFQFLFRELKDTKEVRRWIIKKMNVEFEEMLGTTTGKLLDQITVRDFNLGNCFPIVKSAALKNVVSKDENKALDEIDIMVDLTYEGGFQLAVDVDLVFGKSAFLSVTLTKLCGTARLQLSRLPYTHWSFSFYEDPVMDFQVESQFEGRPIPQITSLIINQIRRAIRKKHTLPNYKIRYKPFFRKPETPPPCQDVYLHGVKLSTGQLEVTIIDCERLAKLATDTFVYCTLAIDSLPWVELMTSRKKLWVSLDIEIQKGQSTFIGLTFKEEFLLDKYEEVVIVETVFPNTPAGQSDIKQNDVLVAIAGIRVTSSKQAAKLMKQAPEKFPVRVERSQLKRPSISDFKFEEDTISLKDVQKDPMDGTQVEVLDDHEEYINITIKNPQTESDNIDKHYSSVLPSKDKYPVENVELSKELLTSTTSPTKKGFSFLSSGQGIFHRRKLKTNENKIPKNNTDKKAKSDFGAVFYDRRDSSVKTSPPVTRKDVSKTEFSDFYKSESAKELTKLDIKESAKRDSSPSASERKIDLTFGVFQRVPSSDSLKLPVVDTQGSGESDREDSDEKQLSIDLRKTKLHKAAQDLSWNEKFTFDVEESHKYLNVCVWCKIPEKVDKQNRVIKPEKDILIGHVSVALMDMALECLSTIQGDLQRTYKLTPSETKAGASRTKISNLAAHSGFDEKLCYGDVTLAFRHTPNPISKSDRKTIDKKNIEGTLGEEEEGKSEESQNGSPVKRQTVEGQHDFLGTHFQSATYCNFCAKKIWLKQAFQCRVCGMICHKKCTEKCQAQTTCSKGGFQWKDLPPPVVKETTQKEKVSEEGRKDSLKDTAPHKSLLNKLRGKDLGKENGTRSPGGTRRHIPKIFRREPSSDSSPEVHRRRRNSAPDDDKDGAVASTNPIRKSSLGLQGGVPRTRSSTSIQELISQHASPTVSDDKADESSSSDYSDEDEMNLLKYFEEQKQKSQHSDELVVTAAKEMGKELYANLSPEERRIKLDNMVSKFQQEIDEESENRAELARMERETTDPKQKRHIRDKITKSDEKIQALALLMLHYCAGLQHCLNQEEHEKQGRLDEENSREESQEKDVNRQDGGKKDTREIVDEEILQNGKIDEKEKGDNKSHIDEHNIAQTELNDTNVGTEFGVSTASRMQTVIGECMAEKDKTDRNENSTLQNEDEKAGAAISLPDIQISNNVDVDELLTKNIKFDF